MTTSANEEKTDTRRMVTEVPVTPFTVRPASRRKQSSAEWPEFDKCTRLKYPDELDEGLVVLIERLIEERGTLSG